MILTRMRTAMPSYANPSRRPPMAGSCRMRSIHGESTRARAAAAVLAANMDAEKEAEEKEDKHRER